MFADCQEPKMKRSKLLSVIRWRSSPRPALIRAGQPRNKICAVNDETLHIVIWNRPTELPDDRQMVQRSPFIARVVCDRAAGARIYASISRCNGSGSASLVKQADHHRVLDFTFRAAT